jgi:hypothetical protein
MPWTTIEVLFIPGLLREYQNTIPDASRRARSASHVAAARAPPPLFAHGPGRARGRSCEIPRNTARDLEKRRLLVMIASHILLPRGDAAPKLAETRLLARQRQGAICFMDGHATEMARLQVGLPRDPASVVRPIADGWRGRIHEERTLVVANHESLLDGPMLAAFLSVSAVQAEQTR